MIESTRNVRYTRDALRPNARKAEILFGLPGIDSKSAPHLTATLPTVADEVNAQRAIYGLEPIPYDPQRYKLASPEEYDTDPKLGSSLSNGGAFYNPTYDLVVIRNGTGRSEDGKEIAGDSRAIQVSQVYRAAHESVHRGTRGINETLGIGAFSVIVDEGIVEDEARQILSRSVFPDFLELQDGAILEYYEECIEPVGFSIAGVPLVKDDIMYLSPEDTPLVYGGIPEMAVVRALRESNPDAYEAVRREAYQGNPGVAEVIVKNAYGPDIAKALNVRRAVTDNPYHYRRDIPAICDAIKDSQNNHKKVIPVGRSTMAIAAEPEQVVVDADRVPTAIEIPKNFGDGRTSVESTGGEIFSQEAFMMEEPGVDSSTESIADMEAGNAQSTKNFGGRSKTK